MSNQSCLRRIQRSDMLLMLLYASDSVGRKMAPIGGKTRLQKEVFLAQKKLRDNGFFTYYSFRPYIYGPYSIELYDDIEMMEYQGVLSIKKINLGKKGIYSEFVITEKGKKEVEEKIKDETMYMCLNVIEEIKKNYNDMNIVDLVELTHKFYPEYHK